MVACSFQGRLQRLQVLLHKRQAGVEAVPLATAGCSDLFRCAGFDGPICLRRLAWSAGDVWAASVGTYAANAVAAGECCGCQCDFGGLGGVKGVVLGLRTEIVRGLEERLWIC